MLRVTIILAENFDERTNRFVTGDAIAFELEHSLVSLSKWESKWEIPFLGPKPKTREQTLDYIKMMILGKIPPGDFLGKLSSGNFEEINTYINAKMTATWFRETRPVKKNREIVTSELIYYWMISLGIPFECQYWHLNRLLTLIRVCNEKNSPKKKMSRAEATAWQREQNLMRRAQLGTKG